MAQGYIQDLRRKLRQKRLDRLRAKIAEILRLINTPLADIIRDHALLCLPVASLLRFRSVSVFWDHLISSPIFVDRLHAKIAEILRLATLHSSTSFAIMPSPASSSPPSFASAPSSSPRTASSPSPYSPSPSSTAIAPSPVSFPLPPPLARYSNPSIRSPTPSPTPSAPSSLAPRSSSDPHPTTSSATSPFPPFTLISSAT